jgi:sec-independent protein translocase protein TatA
MGTFSIWHWLIVLVVVLLLFGGAGKIPKLMRDMGQGINAFKKGLKEEDKPAEQKSVEAKESIEQTSAKSEKKDEVASS